MRTIKLLVLSTFTFLLLGCDNRGQSYQGYAEGENIYLATPFSGTLEQLCIDIGQRVKKGDLLFKLEEAPQSFSLDEAKASLMQAESVLKDLMNPKRPPEIAAIEAQIKQAEAQIRLAAARVRRNQILYNKHVVDKDTLDAFVEKEQELVQLKVQYEQNLRLAKEGSRIEQINAQKAQVQAIVNKVKNAAWQVQQKIVYAPEDGIIFDTYYKEGEYVPAQRPVAALLAPRYLDIIFFVPVNVAERLATGQTIEFESDYSKGRFQAVIRYIAPEAEYVPPLVYSKENKNKLVFRVKAHAKDKNINIKPGQPLIIYLGSKHGRRLNH